MSAPSAPVPFVVRRIPHSWQIGTDAGEFFAVSTPVGPETAVISILAAEKADPDYLLTRYRTRVSGPLGRPIVQSLPELLADGVSVLSFSEATDGTLVARIDLVRRAWNSDIVISAVGVALGNTDALFSDMLDLLWEVRPEGNP